MKKLVFMFALTSFAALPAAAADENQYSGVTLGQDSAVLSAATTESYRNPTANHGVTLGEKKATYKGTVLGSAKPQAKKKYVYDTSLTHAIKMGNEDRVRMLTYTSGIDVNQRNYAGLTPLTIAAEKGPLSIVKMLVNKGADVNMRSSYGITPLIAATAAQNVDIAKYLVSKGADASLKDEFDRSPLIYAMDYDNPKMISVLSKNNEEACNAVDASLNTPLLYTVKKGNLQNVKTLVGNGANADYRNPNTGLFPLAVASAEDYPEIIKVLVRNGKANTDLTDLSGRTALFFAIENGHLNSAKALLDLGANPNAQDIVGVTPLMRAVAKGDQDMINLLLKQRNIDMTLKDAQGRTALMYSAYAPNVTGAEILLDRGMNMDAQDDLGNTALLNAIQAQNDQVALYFLNQGADISKINHQYQDAWTLAEAFLPNSETAKELQQHHKELYQQALQNEAAALSKMQQLESELAKDNQRVQKMQQQAKEQAAQQQEYLEDQVSQEVTIGLPVVTAANDQAQQELQVTSDDPEAVLDALQQDTYKRSEQAKQKAEAKAQAQQEKLDKKAKAQQEKAEKKAQKEQQKLAKAQKKAEEKAAKAKKKAKAEALKAAQQFEKAQQAAEEAAAAANEAAYQAVDDTIEMVD